MINANRGPSPDDPDESLNERLTRIISDSTARAVVNIQGYRESNESWQKWILTICSGMVLTGIGSVIVMYGKLQALEQRCVSIEQQLQDLKRLVEPRYRSGP